MRNIYKLVVLCSLVAAILVTTASAHTTSQSGILDTEYIEEYGRYGIGGEDVGWSIDEECHIGSTSFEYAFTDLTGYQVPATLKAIVRSGAALWAGTVTISESSTSANYIYRFYDPDDNTIGLFTPLGIDETSGHITQWNIQLNGAYEIDASIVAHEFGHVIGLNDLYNDANTNKLMYGYSNSSATSPTSSDLWGAQVILGIHTNHNFSGYRLCGKDADGNNIHVQYCTDCNGNSLNQSCCFYGFGNTTVVCLRCGSSRMDTVD